MKTMRRKRNRNKRIVTIAVMLLLCLLAGLYIVKTVNKRAEEARAAELAEQQAQEEAARAEEAAKAEEASAKKADRVYAYRGSSDDGKFTMEAYENAVNAGAGTIVIPFVVSQDDTMYVADDDYSQDLTGYAGYFSGMTDGQIDNLQTKSGTKVLKVSDVFDKFGGDVQYVLELKYTSERNLEALRKIIEDHGNEDSIIVSSEFFKGLRTLEGSLPDVKKIFMCREESEFGEAKNLEFVDMIAVNSDILSEDYCKDAHDHDKKFGAWPLNTEEEVKKAIEMGADFFFTDEATTAVKAEGGGDGGAEGDPEADTEADAEE